MALQTVNQFDIGTKFSNLGSGFAQGQQFGLNRQAGQRAQAQEARNVTADDQQQSQIRAATINKLAINLSQLPLEQRPAALAQSGDTLRSFNIDPTVFEGADLTDATLSEVIAGTGGVATVAGPSALDQARTAKITAETEQIGKPKPPKRTTLESNLISAGLTPGTPEFQAAILKATNKPLVSVGSEDNSFSKALGAKNAATFGKVNEQRDSAIEANQSLDVLENIDVASGKLEPFIQGLAAWGKAFGVDTSGLANVSAGEAFNAEAQRIVLSVKASQKGPQTDKDEATIRKTVANLGNTQEGNQFIMNSARALNNRRIERADFYDNFIQENGGKFRDENRQTADAAWAKFKRETPMVSANRRTPEGLPVFFYKFNQEVRQANPDASKAEILQAWRDSDKKRVK